ncbi:cysteine hydrolase family protein [Alpinimonas psychrophila]|uniref:Nicotinamidase-related amidase n=1 Tax=Alpinimonas psychrophila TaxID=748908 RepID=A0A7W3JSG7_9MICO|nr:cysteine hydrolase family protein [Alpinimonas psychrophila]MBA8828414.1 nicotinamidase-related amidase [Alpinimonas psychrophila]
MHISADAALIVIDVQQGFQINDYWGPRNNPAADDNIALILEAWKKAKRPIVIVHHDSADPDSPLTPSHPGNALKPYVAAAEPALVIAKSVNSAFYGTPDLHAWLQEKNIGQLFIVGIQTNMCCETTARMAGNLGYDVFFVADATHTFDLKSDDGDTMTAAELSRATSINLSGGEFATVVTTAEVVA